MPDAQDRAARIGPVLAAAAWLLSPEYTVDGHGRVRAGVDLGHLGELLTRVSGVYAGAALSEGVLLLDQGAAVALGLPTVIDGGRRRRGKTRAEVPDPYPLEDARAHGWSCSRYSDWMTFKCEGRPAVHLGVLPLIDVPQCSHCGCDHPGCDDRHRVGTCECPLLADPIDMPAGFARWQALTGRAWHHTPGIAGMSIWRATAPTGRQTPTYRLKDPGPARRDAQETAVTWVAPPEHRTGGAYEHKYDGVRAYVGAFNVLHVAPHALHHTGKMAFNALLPGWWKIEVPPWNEARLPHPAGPGRPRRKGAPGVEVRWVTTPTMVLLAELAEQGRIAFPTIVDSWTGRPWSTKTGQAGKRLFLPLCTTLAQAYAAPADDVTDPGDVERVDQAVKMCGREVFGLFGDEDNWAYRWDWHCAGIAQWRCNLWRRCDRAAREENRYPVRIDTDAVWYRSDNPNAKEAAPAAFPIGDGSQLGTFRVKGTRKVDAP